MLLIPSGSLMDMPLPPGWTLTRAFICICFRLLQNSQPQPCARSCRWGSATFDVLPRSPPSGRSGCCCSVACTSYLCTTVNSLQQLQILVWGQQGHRHRQMSQSQEESGTRPYQNPRPNRLHTARGIGCVR